MKPKREDIRATRFKISLTNFYDHKLNRLSVSCSMNKAQLAQKLIFYSMFSEQMFLYIKRHYLFLFSPTKKGTGQSRCARIQISVTNNQMTRLNNLSKLMDKELGTKYKKSKTKSATLGSVFVRVCLDSPNIIDYFQTKYNKIDDYRVIPIVNDKGEVFY